MGNAQHRTTKAPNAQHNTDDMINQLNLYHSNEFDELLDEIEEAADADPYATAAISVVPSANIVHSIDSIFDYEQQLGQGASCRVLKARHLQSHKIYAVKEMKKTDPVNAQLFHNEVKILQKLVHPNILQFHDCYMDQEHYYIATEYCSGGTVLDKIIEMNTFSEQKASNYIATILSVINYMHSLNIVHRDLKAQNMVFDKEGISGQLQIIDFGDCMVVKESEVYKELVGTIFYIAPESRRPRTGLELKASDMWSIGVITYLLVCGRPPFVGNSVKEILKSIQFTHNITFPNSAHLTASCKDFIRKLLCRDVQQRLTAEQALQHPWISGNAASDKSFSSDYLRSLSKYNYSNKLQQVLVNAILSETDEKEQAILCKGILALNQQEASMCGSSIVNYLLLHTSVSQAQFQQQRLIAAKTGSYEEEEFNWTHLEQLGVDNILQQIEQNEAKTVSDDEEEMDEDDDESTCTASPLTPQDMLQRKISVEQFRGILKKSSKQYDVEDIVNDLHDGQGHISLSDIGSYHKHIATVLPDQMDALCQAANDNTANQQ